MSDEISTDLQRPIEKRKTEERTGNLHKAREKSIERSPLTQSGDSF